MFFDSLTDFIQMGGHGLYVWLYYGLGLLMILLNVWWVRRSRRVFFYQHSRRVAGQVDPDAESSSTFSEAGR